MENQKKNKNTKKGFTLLFAVLVSTMVLAIGASVISIALKQVVLSGSARDSQFAFYAANTGIECALYHGYNSSASTTGQVNIFKRSDEQEELDGSDDEKNIKCAGYNIIDNIDDSEDFDIACEAGSINKDKGFCVKKIDSNHYQTKFRIVFEDLEICTDVVVDRQLDDSGADITTIESRGYNTCNEDNPRRIERTLYTDTSF